MAPDCSLVQSAQRARWIVFFPQIPARIESRFIVKIQPYRDDPSRTPVGVARGENDHGDARRARLNAGSAATGRAGGT